MSLLSLALALAPSAQAAERGIRNHLLLIHQLYEASDYERALAQVEVARQEKHDTDEDVTLSLYEGILRCELNQQDEGKASFRTAFLLRPDAKLPEQVSPKIEADAESVRRRVKKDLTDTPAARKHELLTPKPQAPDTSSLTDVAEARSTPSKARQYARVPAIAGGALAVAGGVSWGISRVYLNRLRGASTSTSDAELIQWASRGDKWQTAGVSLLAVGATGLAAAAGMYFWGGGEKPAMSLGASPGGASLVIQGRWP